MIVPGSMALTPSSQIPMRSPEIPYRVRIDIPDGVLLSHPSFDETELYFKEQAMLGGFDKVSSWHSPNMMCSSMRGEMNRQGTITDLGTAEYQEHGEIRGSLAIKVSLEDDKVRLDLRIVNDAGGVLAEWEGVDVIDDSQITWCFSDVGDIKLVMNPIIEPDD